LTKYTKAIHGVALISVVLSWLFCGTPTWVVAAPFVAALLLPLVVVVLAFVAALLVVPVAAAMIVYVARIAGVN
jgi:hypothetical protein